MLVDDEPEVAEVIELMLIQLGYQVRALNDGRQALEAFSSASYDLVVTDLHMPGLDGHELARAVKERKPGTPVLMITGWGLQVNVSEIGGDRVIAKPVTKEVLAREVAALTGEKIAGERRADWTLNQRTNL